jgi:predicted acylesterase/phospholipase RssA
MSSTTVVLGGGGLAGIGWLTGVLAALEETGALTLADADTVIGTSPARPSVRRFSNPARRSRNSM